MSGPTPTPDCRFRHEGEFGERVALASYPRSGNTMARKLLEEVTGIFTGSDTRGGRAMADMLKGYGLMGEANCTRSSWVIKTHFPERLGWMKFPVRRAILLVRHPVNAIDSYFNMQLAACHTMSLDESSSGSVALLVALPAFLSVSTHRIVKISSSLPSSCM